MSRANIKPDCQEIEYILLKGSVEEISTQEQQLIEQHLNFCPQCKKYEHFLLDIKRAITSSPDNNVEPFPRIRENALKKISGYPGVISMFWNSIISLFEYRIPIYQALVMIFIIFVLLVGFNFASSRQNSFMILSSEWNKSEGMLSNENFALDSLQLLERQRIGKNVLEDSVITRLITTAM